MGTLGVVHPVDPTRYRIEVRGDVGGLLSGPLDVLTLESAGRESVLAGLIADQAQLQGVLRTLGQPGIEIISVNPVQET